MLRHVEERAPAKLNLALHVVGRREDGYHALETVVAFTEFGDVVRAEIAEHDTFGADGPFAAALGDGPNLVELARDALRARARASTPVALTLIKRLPVASGIGGGSADAAATLRALARLWHVGPPEAIEGLLCEIGAGLGADVPMCVLSRPLVASGVGERLVPLEPGTFDRGSVVLVNPSVPLSTPEVFARLTSRENPPLPPLSERAPIDWLATARNDLEPSARSLVPEVGEALDALAPARFARMSGSGATCYGLFEGEDEADACAEAIRQTHPEWFVVATRLAALQPEGAPS